MNTGRNTVLVCFAIVGVFLIGVIRFAHWPVWASVVLVLAFVGSVLIFMATRPWSTPVAQSPPVESAFADEPVPPPVEHKKERIADVLLPSDRQYYYFLFSAGVLWSPLQSAIDESTVNMTALAVDAILTRAREITEQRDPGHASLVQHELSRALAEMHQDATGRLVAMAESVHLVLPGHDQQRLDKLAAVRKDEDVWEYERRYEQSKREYLGADVLKSPGSAVVWWLARNDDQVEKTVQDIGILSQLSHAANNVHAQEPSWQLASPITSPHGSDAHQSDLNGAGASEPPEDKISATDHFDAFLRAMNLTGDDPQRVLFARRVADLAARHGRPEIADEMAQRFDMPEEPEHPGEMSDGD